MKKDLSLRGQKRDWQLWSALTIAAGVLGILLALYGLLQPPPGTWTPQGLALQLVPPLFYGVISLLVLINFYLAQKEAAIRGLENELLNEKMESELNRELALLDPVTEVYNRRYLRAILNKEVSRAKRYAQGMSVMMLDITGFRRVNESLGHTGGDLVLRQVAHLVQTRIRNSDYIVRFGGDEFLLILPDTGEANARLLGMRVQDAFVEWSKDRGMVAFALRLAVGVATYTGSVLIEEVLKQAEQRMIEDRRPGEPGEEERVFSQASVDKSAKPRLRSAEQPNSN